MRIAFALGMRSSPSGCSLASPRGCGRSQQVYRPVRSRPPAATRSAILVRAGLATHAGIGEGTEAHRMTTAATAGNPAPLDIVSIGEPMVELNQTDPGAPRYLQGFGGDTSNMVIAAARSGARCGYVTRLGDDEFGRMFLDLWGAEGVDCSGVTIDRAAHTAVYFVTHGSQGHVFSYL